MFPDFIDGDISGILDADFAQFPSQNISHFFMALYRPLRIWRKAIMINPPRQRTMWGTLLDFVGRTC